MLPWYSTIGVRIDFGKMIVRAALGPFRDPQIISMLISLSSVFGTLKSSVTIGVPEPGGRGEEGGGRADQVSPGVTIVIEQIGRLDHIIGPRPHVIEARPDEFQDVDIQDAR
jgi:hypothetical protein